MPLASNASAEPLPDDPPTSPPPTTTPPVPAFQISPSVKDLPGYFEELRGGSYRIPTAVCNINTQWAHQSGSYIAVHATTSCNYAQSEIGIHVILWRWTGSEWQNSYGDTTKIDFGKPYLDARAATLCPGPAKGYWYTGTAYHWSWYYGAYGSGSSESTAVVWVQC